MQPTILLHISELSLFVKGIEVAQSEINSNEMNRNSTHCCCASMFEL